MDIQRNTKAESHMDDGSFVAALKRKRDCHLAEIAKLKGLVGSINDLIAEYSREMGATKQELSSDSPAPESIQEVDILSLNLTDAMVCVMRSNPSNRWRGADIHRVLKSKGYQLNNLSQKIAARLLERAKAATGKWQRFESEDGYPRYQLREHG